MYVRYVTVDLHEQNLMDYYFRGEKSDAHDLVGLLKSSISNGYVVDIFRTQLAIEKSHGSENEIYSTIY